MTRWSQYAFVDEGVKDAADGSACVHRTTLRGVDDLSRAKILVNNSRPTMMWHATGAGARSFAQAERTTEEMRDGARPNSNMV